MKPPTSRRPSIWQGPMDCPSTMHALYLEVAKRRNAPLATLDGGLTKAAIMEGLGVPAAYEDGASSTGE